MNANELADALDMIGDRYLVILGDIEFKKAADFVRQQQAEIEALEMRELTDEEIDEVLYSMDWAHDPVEFARAILRKAQEK